MIRGYNLNMKPILTRYREIGPRIFGDEPDPAIEEMRELKKEFEALPLEEQNEFLLEVHGEMFGSNPDETIEEKLAEARETTWNFWPRWDGN